MMPIDRDEQAQQQRPINGPLASTKASLGGPEKFSRNCGKNSVPKATTVQVMIRPSSQTLLPIPGRTRRAGG